MVSSEEWRAISTHHIMLGTAPIGGHRAMEQAGDSLQNPVCGREAARGVSTHQVWSSLRKTPASLPPFPPPHPQPCSPRRFVSLYIYVTFTFSLSFPMSESRAEPSELPHVLSTWHICRKNEWMNE